MNSTEEYIYETSRSLLPAALAWSRRHTSLDSSTIEDILQDTVLSFISRKPVDISDISHFPSYFFQSFKNRVYHFLTKNLPGKIVELDGKILENLSYYPSIQQEIEKIEMSFLFEKLINEMDEKSLFIIEQFLLNYSYKEIVPKYNEKFQTNAKENFLRSKLHKAIHKLKLKMNESIR